MGFRGQLGKAVGLPAVTSGVIQVKSTTLSAASTITPAGTFTDIGLSVTITPTSASNLVLITGSLSLSNSFNGALAWRLLRDATAIGVGDALGANRRRSTGADRTDNGVNDDPPSNNQPVEYLDSPASIVAITYKIQAVQLFTGSIGINRGLTNTDSTNYPVTISTLTAMEVRP